MGGKKFRITPVGEDKGVLSISGPGADGLVHLKWKNRESGAVDPDVLVFPNEWKIEKVDTGREGDRVWVLQLSKNLSRRHFFWSLEADEAVEIEKVGKLSEYLRNPSSIPPSAANLGGGGLGGMSQQQLLQMLGGAGGNPQMLAQ